LRLESELPSGLSIAREARLSDGIGFGLFRREEGLVEPRLLFVSTAGLVRGDLR